MEPDLVMADLLVEAEEPKLQVVPQVVVMVGLLEEHLVQAAVLEIIITPAAAAVGMVAVLEQDKLELVVALLILMA